MEVYSWKNPPAKYGQKYGTNVRPFQDPEIPIDTWDEWFMGVYCSVIEHQIIRIYINNYLVFNYY